MTDYGGMGIMHYPSHLDVWLFTAFEKSNDVGIYLSIVKCDLWPNFGIIYKNDINFNESSKTGCKFSL